MGINLPNNVQNGKCRLPTNSWNKLVASFAAVKRQISSKRKDIRSPYVEKWIFFFIPAYSCITFCLGEGSKTSKRRVTVWVCFFIVIIIHSPLSAQKPISFSIPELPQIETLLNRLYCAG